MAAIGGLDLFQLKETLMASCAVIHGLDILIHLLSELISGLVNVGMVTHTWIFLNIVKHMVYVLWSLPTFLLG